MISCPISDFSFDPVQYFQATALVGNQVMFFDLRQPKSVLLAYELDSNMPPFSFLKLWPWVDCGKRGFYFFSSFIFILFFSFLHLSLSLYLSLSLFFPVVHESSHITPNSNISYKKILL